MVRAGMVRCHAMMRRLLVMVIGLLMKRTRPSVAKRGSVMMRSVGILMLVVLALLARMRVLW
jgi:hypothetical protein